MIYNPRKYHTVKIDTKTNINTPMCSKSRKSGQMHTIKLYLKQDTKKVVLNMFFKILNVLVIIFFSATLNANRTSTIRYHQTKWQNTNDTLIIARLYDSGNFRHANRRNFQNVHRSSRNIYKNNRRAFKNNQRGYIGGKYRGNIYTNRPSKLYRQRYKLRNHGTGQLGNYYRNDRYYKSNRYFRYNGYRFRANRWINNRYYRWYVPAAGILLYQGRNCYIDGVGEGEIIDDVCCSYIDNTCTDEFFVTGS